MFGAKLKQANEKLKSERDQFKKWFESAMMMVDHTPIGILWCNAEDAFAITYANDAAYESLGEIQKHLSCPAKEISGKSIDVLFSAAGLAAPRVQDPSKLPFHGLLRIGPETLDVQIRAIHDKKHHYCGAMVAWRSVTKEMNLANTFEASIKAVVETIATSSGELQSNAETMTNVADEVNKRSVAVAAASQQASQNVQTVATAAEELSSSIEEIGRQVTQSSTIAGDAVQEADHVNATVKNLMESAQRIGEGVALITDIAEQTNLLALNATIEAARAGDAGKGFAVVANEVKSLANQTGKATEDIASQVTAIQGSTKDAVQAIAGIGTTITKINEIAGAIAAAVEEQGAAIQEIARNISQAAGGTQDVTANIGSVSDLATEAGGASTRVLETAQQLRGQSEQLRQEVVRFLGTIRTA